jgi:hypothetical protein
MNLIWPNTIEENQSKKPKKGVRTGGHTTLHTPKIQELAEELEAISHPNVEQERLREILRSTAIWIQSGKAHSKQPAR